MSVPARREIAIIGMSCVFPGARNLQRFWENILHKVDAVSDPPPDWEAGLFYDPESRSNDRTYCRRGGWLGKLAEFNPLEFGVMPNSVDGAEPDHFLALRAATEALADAGYQDPARLKLVRERTEVIIGRGTYVNRGNTTVVQHAVVVDSLLRVLKQLHPEHTEEELAEIKRQLKAGLPSFTADTAPGLVPNIISGRIANRLDLMGPNYIVDAACASSLVAIDLAINDLLSGRCDMALAGGVHASTPPPILVIFSQLNALSHKGQIRPFDQDADGTLLGEGVGMLVLKRLDDAERAGDRIYAVIKGVGTASDGRALGLLAPRLEGEELALRRAYAAAEVDPATVELIEAHGTATPVGDVVEVEALNRLFGPRRGEIPGCALGSVKSMISHTMPASGSAGLIKAALALHHKVLPPTLHCENPNPKLELDKHNLYLNTETRPWIHGSRETPRRAGVNAFGFGGINAHVVLEEYTGPNVAAPLQYDWDSELFVVTGETRDGLLTEARRLQEFLASAPEDLALRNLAWTLNCTRELKPVRLSLIAASREDLGAKLGRAIERISDQRTKRIREVDGIYFFSQPAGPGGKLAFVFPGEGAQYPHMLADLAMHFPEVREVFDQMDRAFAGHPRGYLPSHTIFPPPGFAAERLYSMDSGAESVFIANQALYALMEELEIRPHCMVGHSTGEHSALLCSGTVLAEDEAELFRHVRGVNAVFEDMRASTEIPEGVLLAVAGARHALLESLVEKSNGKVFIALDNCPHQVVMCGTEAGIQWMMQELEGEAAICQKLPFARAYHTPWFEVFSQPLRRYFDTARIGRPSVPLYSCITTRLYPEDDPDQVRDLTAIQWARCVRFRETIEAMYRDGVRIFVEVGPRGNLTGFIDDSLRGKACIAIPSNTQHRSGIQQLNHLAGQLAAHGVPLRLAHLYERRAPQTITEQAATKKKSSLTLSGGLRPVRLPESFPPFAPAQAVVTEPPRSRSPLRRRSSRLFPNLGPSRVLPLPPSSTSTSPPWRSFSRSSPRSCKPTWAAAPRRRWRPNPWSPRYPSSPKSSNSYPVYAPKRATASLSTANRFSAITLSAATSPAPIRTCPACPWCRSPSPWRSSPRPLPCSPPARSSPVCATSADIAGSPWNSRMSPSSWPPKSASPAPFTSPCASSARPMCAAPCGPKASCSSRMLIRKPFPATSAWSPKSLPAGRPSFSIAMACFTGRPSRPCKESSAPRRTAASPPWKFRPVTNYLPAIPSLVSLPTPCCSMPPARLSPSGLRKNWIRAAISSPIASEPCTVMPRRSRPARAWSAASWPPTSTRKKFVPTSSWSIRKAVCSIAWKAGKTGAFRSLPGSGNCASLPARPISLYPGTSPWPLSSSAVCSLAAVWKASPPISSKPRTKSG